MSTGLDIHEHLHRTDTSGASSGPADALRSTLAQAKSVGDLEYNGACPEPMRRNGLNPVQELQAGAPSANMLTGLGIDEYLQRTDASGASSYLTDALGSTLALANPAGGLATSYTYDPFGNTTIAGSSTNPFQFTGRENDGTGLYFYRARYYSPSQQRFVAQDPKQFKSGDANFYMYGEDSPLVFTDPSGLTVYICTRKVAGFPYLGNHAFLYNDQNNQSCQNEGSDSSGFDPNTSNGNPLTNPRYACRAIPFSANEEDSLMACCHKGDSNYMNGGLYIPGLDDCHTKANRCIYDKGFDNPGAPGGRLGPLVP